MKKNVRRIEKQTGRECPHNEQNGERGREEIWNGLGKVKEKLNGSYCNTLFRFKSTLDFLLTISNFATIYHLTLIISRLCAQYLLTLYFDALISEKRRFCSVLCVLKKLCLDTV